MFTQLLAAKEWNQAAELVRQSLTAAEQMPLEDWLAAGDLTDIKDEKQAAAEYANEFETWRK